MLKILINNFMKKHIKGTNLAAENIVYMDQVYPLYLKTQSSFKYCMQHKLLKREDILEFKYMLNNFIDTKKYKHEKFKNDAHEIYRKLKDIDITKSHMSKLYRHLESFK